ncbi:hypothetical protein DPEC_G00259390 [Dallia pectoralis]|uniref:Uncharacterized protein n=1 Tax=Dallia pectoralis TaxID=75939 RepID=A0ACC2FRM2_DALPE|nr:hypothetical protein DPEC_G00259390 [Dallia pectoralis]
MTNKDVDDRPTKDVDDPDAESDGPETSLCTPCRPSQVKIGNDGTVTVSSHCWETAKACTTPNGMARVLLMGLFSLDVLLKSNVKGGVSKLDSYAECRHALDPRILQALQATHGGAKSSPDARWSGDMLVLYPFSQNKSPGLCGVW